VAQIFHRSANTFSKLTIYAAVLIAAAFALIIGQLVRSPYATNVGVVLPQPVPFSHKHHVSGIGIDCRYCHTTVEESAFAGIPSTKTCMTCHSQVWADSPTLEPVRASFRDNRPLKWTRVHDLADFAYFDHSIHLKKGIGCVSCHGQVDDMPLMWKTATLQMEWCLNCHWNPAAHVRPREEVFNMRWEPPADRERLAMTLIEEYGIRNKTDCSVCHR
jgi:hypothetical protein